MASLDLEYRKQKSATLSFVGAFLVTGFLFSLIGVTRFDPELSFRDHDTEISVLYIPPPAEPATEHRRAPKSTASQEVTSFDFSFDQDVSDVELNFIDVQLESSAVKALSLDYGIDAGFRASKPSMEEIPEFVVFERHEVDEPPHRRYTTIPDLPRELKNHEATLIVFYFVTKKGRPESVSVLDSTTDIEAFKDIAKEEILKWRFRPAMKDGKPVNAWVQHEFNFTPGPKSPFSI